MSHPNAYRMNHHGDTRALSTGRRLHATLRAQSEGRRRARREDYTEDVHNHAQAGRDSDTLSSCLKLW